MSLQRLENGDELYTWKNRSLTFWLNSLFAAFGKYVTYLNLEELEINIFTNFMNMLYRVNLHALKGYLWISRFKVKDRMNYYLFKPHIFTVPSFLSVRIQY